MKTLIIALALVAMAHAYSLDDIPSHMRDRLDRYIALKKQWEQKWTAMDVDEQMRYEHILLDRIDHLPEIEHKRMFARIEAMPEEKRTKLRDYLRTRFPVEGEAVFDNEVDEIDEIIKNLPETVRDRISNIINAQFQEATAYDAESEASEDEFDFPDIPEIFDLPETAAYSEELPEEIRVRFDEFLLKREDWKIKWEHLSEEKRVVLEQYIDEHMQN